MDLFAGEQFGRGTTQRRNQSEENARQERYSESKEQHASVDAGLFQARNPVRCNGNKETKQELREPATREAAQNSQEQAFRECLANQASARRAKGCVNCQFPHAAGSTCEEQVCHVGASDQQNGQNRAEKYPRGNTGVLDLPIAKGANAERHFMPK